MAEGIRKHLNMRQDHIHTTHTKCELKKEQRLLQYMQNVLKKK